MQFFLLLLTILLNHTFSQSQSLYSRLKKDLDAVENKIQQEHRSLSGGIAKMENTLIMKIQEMAKEASTESTTKKTGNNFSNEDPYPYFDPYLTGMHALLDHSAQCAD